MAFAILLYGFALRIGQNSPYLSISHLTFLTFITTGGDWWSRRMYMPRAPLA
jgi:hypothetical protein